MSRREEQELQGSYPHRVVPFLQTIDNPHLTHPYQPTYAPKYVGCGCSQPVEVGALAISTNATIEWPRGTTVTRVKPDVAMTLYATDCGLLSTNVTFTITDDAGHVYGTWLADVNISFTARVDNVVTPHEEGMYQLEAHPNHGAVGYLPFEVNSSAVSPGEAWDAKKIFTYAAIGVGVLGLLYVGVNYMSRRK